MRPDIWTRAARAVCREWLARALNISEEEFARELYKQFPSEKALRAMWKREARARPALRGALD